MESNSYNEPELSFLKRIWNANRKLGWSFLGVILALIFGGLFIYTEFVKDKNPQLQYEILTNTSVFDVKEEVGNLSVLFDGIDIRQKELSLRVITINVLNNSSVDILKGYYDDRIPLGLTISKGKIIKHELLSASNKYLENNLEFKTEGDNVLHFPNLIIEARECFSLKLLVLHKKLDWPTIEPTGKIAGIKKIQVLEPYKERGKEPFWNQVFKGEFSVQVTKTISYTLIAILSVTCFFLPLVTVGNIQDRIKKKKAVNDFKSGTTLKLRPSDESIFRYCLKNDSWEIFHLERMIDSLENFTKDDEVGHKPKGTDGESLMIDKSKLESTRYWSVDEMDLCLKLGLLKKTNYGLALDTNLIKISKDLVSFLQDRGLVISYAEKDDEGLSKAQKKFLDSIYP